MTILGIIGIVLIVKECGTMWILRIIKSIYIAISSVKANFTISGIIMANIKKFVISNLQYFALVFTFLIVVCLLVVLLNKLISKNES